VGVLIDGFVVCHCIGVCDYICPDNDNRQRSESEVLYPEEVTLVENDGLAVEQKCVGR
jgi:hypothetical protein